MKNKYSFLLKKSPSYIDNQLAIHRWITRNTMGYPILLIASLKSLQNFDRMTIHVYLNVKNTLSTSYLGNVCWKCWFWVILFLYLFLPPQFNKACILLQSKVSNLCGPTPTMSSIGHNSWLLDTFNYVLNYLYDLFYQKWIIYIIYVLAKHYWNENR